MSIEERVRKVVSEQLDVSGEIDNNASFIDDLGADSLDTVELVMSLEEEFDTEIADEEAENITTIQQAIDYICLLYTSPSPRDATLSRMPSSA